MCVCVCVLFKNYNCIVDTYFVRCVVWHHFRHYVQSVPEYTNILSLETYLLLKNAAATFLVINTWDHIVWIIFWYTFFFWHKIQLCAYKSYINVNLPVIRWYSQIFACNTNNRLVFIIWYCIRWYDTDKREYPS